MAATAWQSHSIRGFISGQLVKKMGLRVKSFKRDGERVYAIRHSPFHFASEASRASLPGLFLLRWRSDS